jgi:Lrp/AsnC family leucine-responsive transcriptional regulator
VRLSAYFAEEMIDKVDRNILRALQEDGRITNLQLAARCALSPSACLERTRRLKEEGYIRRFTALLEPKLLDQALTIFIEVHLERTNAAGLERFGEAVAEQPRIVECHMIAGGFDYLLKIRAADMEDYRRFLLDDLARLPGIRETRSYAVLDEVKHTTQLRL